MRIGIFILCFLVVFPLQSLTVSARGRLENLAINSINLSNNDVYIDILISIDENDEAYTPFNEKNMKRYSFDTKELANYNDEGFMSMSYHYRDNFTEMKIQPNARGEYINSFTLCEISDGSLVQNYPLVHKLLNENSQFRIAILDENGSIIQLSKSFSGKGKYGLLIHNISYDVENNTLYLDYEHDDEPLYWVRTISLKYIIIGIIIFILIIKILIFKFRHFTSEHKDSQ